MKISFKGDENIFYIDKERYEAVYYKKSDKSPYPSLGYQMLVNFSQDKDATLKRIEFYGNFLSQVYEINNISKEKIIEFLQLKDS